MRVKDIHRAVAIRRQAQELKEHSYSIETKCQNKFDSANFASAVVFLTPHTILRVSEKPMTVTFGRDSSIEHCCSSRFSSGFRAGIFGLFKVLPTVSRPLRLPCCFFGRSRLIGFCLAPPVPDSTNCFDYVLRARNRL